MLSNYLIVAVRNLLRFRMYSAINIVGLGLGLACCILLVLYVQHEMSYDRNHKHASRIHRILRETRLEDGTVTISDGTSGALAAA